jgi:ADP-heptose:LPS heptosyltransferase
MLKALEHKIKALVFNGCRLMLRKGRGNLHLNPDNVKRVLFLRPEKIGDMVISMPTFDALHRAFPHIKISLLASPTNKSLVINDPRFEKVFVYRKQFGDLSQISEVRDQNYDCVLDMIDGDSVTTLFYSQLLGKRPVRIGIGKDKHAVYYDFNHVHVDGIGGHIVDNTLKLLEPLGVDVSGVSGFVPPHIPNEAGEKIACLLAKASRPDDLLVGFNLSAGRPNRIWPAEACEQLGRLLLEQVPHLRLVLIVTPGDRDRGTDLLHRMQDSRVVLVPDGLTLLEVSALISRLQLLISPDTSLIHIGRSFRVPVVGLYNRAGKNFRRWQPYRQLDGAVVGQHIDNLLDITPDQVMERVLHVLAARTEVGN